VTEFSNQTFVYWATERTKIRQKRESGHEGPWSSDPIMRGFRFCNVSREDDRGTRFVKQWIRDPLDAGPSDHLFQNVLLSRFINLPETLQELIEKGAMCNGPVNWEAVQELVYARMQADLPTYSGAYMVRSKPVAQPPFFGKGKISYLCSTLRTVTLPKAKTRQGFVEELQGHYGIGSFMAGQIAADLAYTHILADAPDHFTWAPMGPGARRGMNLSLGLHAERRIPMDEYLRVGMAQLEAIPEEVHEDHRNRGIPLTLHDVASNVNCETYKYLKIGKGGMGRRYSK
jgi:hypothetical protein